MTFSFPLPPNMANDRVHWRTKNRERKAYIALCDTLQSANALPAPPLVPLDNVRITSTLYVWAPMDDDNAMARAKWTIDWLRTRGYIVDDGRPHCRIEVPEQQIDRKRMRAELTITPL